ncbi:hypothetical protein [Burkholderia sp. AU6039]|uniref:hypothetical protein n=1 Tax=Burkholderia sp. AU6039 TaxID=2015344 RepID=UPI0015C5895F|nr:hypothetical protein [Burkholderia sp. AU6039]
MTLFGVDFATIETCARSVPAIPDELPMWTSGHWSTRDVVNGKSGDQTCRPIEHRQ